MGLTEQKHEQENPPSAEWIDKEQLRAMIPYKGKGADRRPYNENFRELDRLLFSYSYSQHDLRLIRTQILDGLNKKQAAELADAAQAAAQTPPKPK